MGEPGNAPEAQPGRGCGLPRATAKRPAAPLGSVPPDKEARWGRAGGESEWKRNWVRRRETGAEGRTAALTLLLEKSPPIPVRGDRLDLNCLRLRVRPRARLRPATAATYRPQIPPGFRWAWTRRLTATPARLGPLRTSHTTHQGPPPSSSARARPAPPTDAAPT